MKRKQSLNQNMQKAWNNSLVQNWERSWTRLYTFTLLTQLTGRVHHEKCWTGWLTSWNQGCQEMQQKSQHDFPLGPERSLPNGPRDSTYCQPTFGLDSSCTVPVKFLLLVSRFACSRDQALSLWTGSTDSKTLDYQRTNLRDYQIVRTHKKETTWI